MGPSTCRYALVALILLQPAWFAWLSPPEVVPPWFAITVMAGPLLIGLPFVWRLTRNALVVTGCVLLAHFCLAVSEAWATPAARLPALIQMALIVAYFSGMAALRFGPRRAD